MDRPKIVLGHNRRWWSEWAPGYMLINRRICRGPQSRLGRIKGRRGSISS